MSDPNDIVGELSDETLADRVRAGDTDAYGTLWERHSRAARSAAGSFASLSDPDDLVSEAFLQILRALQRDGGPREAFRPYLYRTIRNLALNRRQTDAPTSLELVPDLPTEGDDLETTVMENTVTVHAFRTLPERWQTVLWYTEVEGMQPAEAAPALGLTPNGVAALAHRAREGLKKAWIQAHVSNTRVPSGCKWTTERMSDYARDTLSVAARARFDRHLKSCTRCSILLEEVDNIGRRLASVLLPTVLGGTAAAALIAQSGVAPPPPTAGAEFLTPRPGRLNAASSTSSARHGLLVAAAVVGVVALGGTAFALDGALTTPPPGASPEASTSEPDTDSSQPEPTRAPTPTPTTPAPSAPPVPTPPPTNERPPAPPVVTPPPVPPIPPDVAAPASAVVASPANGSLGNDPKPPLAGSGEPGARVEIERVAGPGAAGVILSTIVPAEGHWTVTSAEPFPDGAHTLRISQVDAAGNRSAPLELTLTIDTVAAPPTVEPVTGVQHYLPTLTGTAEPNALVEMQWADGVSIGTATADTDGTWSLPLTDPGPADAAFVAMQTDLAGNRSSTSDPQTVQFERPEITVPELDAVIASNGGSTTVEVRFGGIPGERVQVLIDGVATGNIHTLEATPLIRTTMPLPDGTHTIAVRYIDPDTGAIGSIDVRSFTIE